jgi:hypothetical protein
VNTRQLWIALTITALASCQDDSSTTFEERNEDPTVGNDALGIAEFETTETETDLHIRGVDVDGNTVAEYKIHIGMVELEDPDEQRTVYGRRAEMSVAGTRYVRSGEGIDPINLVLWGDESDELVLDPYVSSVLGRWGIEYLPRPVDERDDEEVAYSCYGGSSSWPPCGLAGGYSHLCAESYGGSYEYQLYRCNDSYVRHWDRYCGYTPNSSTPCGPAGGGTCGSCGYFERSPAMWPGCDGSITHCQWNI